MTGGKDEREAAQAELDARMAVTAAERTVADVRFAELAERQRAAWRRHRAAKGLLTRAQKDGSAEKIAAAAERERAACAEADETAQAGIEEMQDITGAGIANTGALLDLYREIWPLSETQTDREAGQ
jgi:hypothetical protein